MTRRPRADEEGRTPTIRPLSAKDFEPVVGIDRRIVGRSRRGYMEKRLQAALRHPGAHVQLAAESEGSLVGFVLARIVQGEFGRPEPALLLEAIGVEPDRQHRGVGRALLDGLQDAMRRKGIHELVTQAEWTNRSLLGFLGVMGFSLASRLILECPTSRSTEL
jgi:predicted N-acetyltransferase YhbS